MKIGSGALRGRKLHAPRGHKTRPTSGRLKKSLFDVLGPRLAGARVLDLYAGAGALGIEALSRGASGAVFVESRRQPCDAIRRNIEELGLGERAELVPKDVWAALAKLSAGGEIFDVILADPPYGSHDFEKLLGALGGGSLLGAGGLVVIEHHHKRELAERYGALVLSRRLKAGESAISFYAWTPSDSGNRAREPG